MSVIMMSVIKMSVFMISFIMLIVVMLKVIMLNVVILNVVASCVNNYTNKHGCSSRKILLLFFLMTFNKKGILALKTTFSVKKLFPFSS
jgi:hypothetical protein